MTSPPSICIVSGLDPSGGAGFIADVRVVTAVGGRPVGVVSALTEQDTVGVRAVHACSHEVIGDQLRALLSDIPLAAVKIGMFADVVTAGAIAGALDLTAAAVVWDPILRPTSGAAALSIEELSEVAQLLGPHVTVATPNLAEASAFLGRPVTDHESARAAARDLVGRIGDAILLTGGHLPGDPTDILADATTNLIEIGGDRIGDASSEQADDVHGTGCALSSAMATYLGHGCTVETAARRGREFVAAALAQPVHPGRGAPAVI